MKARQLKITAALVIAAILSSATAVSAASPSPFVGHWQAIDVDGSDIRLTIGGPSSGPFQITWTESYFSFCEGAAGIARGTGVLDAGNENILHAELHLECFTTGNGIDFQITWQFDSDENILAGGELTWYRPGDPRQSPQSRLAVYLVDDFVIGWNWPRGARVKLTINDPTTGPNIDYVAHTTVTPTPFSAEVWWARFDLAGIYEFKPGDEVKLSSKGVTREHIVLPLTVDEVDGEGDYAFGTADPGAQVFIHPWDAWFDPAQANGDGDWHIDFMAQEEPYDLMPGVGGIAEVFDEDGDSTAIDWIMIGLRVNYGHDWVESFYPAGHDVRITVAESDGETIKAVASIVTGPREDWGGEPGFQTSALDWDPFQPDLQPNDWVFANVDNGVTARVQLGDIQGFVDIEADSITGTILSAEISESVQYECLDWGSGQEDPVNKQDENYIFPDGVEEYSCAWDPTTEWDIQAWQDIGVGYFTPEGHWVANSLHAEFWVAMWTFDQLSGFWQEGQYVYSFAWEITYPWYASGASNPVEMVISSGDEEDQTPIYDGFVLLRPRVQRAWTGSDCVDVGVIHPDQPTRFAWGWMNDYSMPYEEALSHFSSLSVTVAWEGAMAGSAGLAMRQLLPSYEWGGDSVCSLTEHP